jgi:spermidine/putrescine-binding protein
MKTRTLLTISAAIMATSAFAQDKSVTIASWGGSYQEAQSKALFEPAAANTVSRSNRKPMEGCPTFACRSLQGR